MAAAERLPFFVKEPQTDVSGLRMRAIVIVAFGPWMLVGPTSPFPGELALCPLCASDLVRELQIDCSVVVWLPELLPNSYVV